MPGGRQKLLVLSFLAFIALGLPDGLLGVAWPSIRESFGLSLEALGSLLFPFTVSYVASSFASGAILARISVGSLLALSCLVTGASLAGYAVAPLWAIMIGCASIAGLGAGAIDAGVNAYVAANHGPRTLNWMHAAYGIGAATGPLVMTGVLRSGRPWQTGYALAAVGQLVLAAAFAASRRSWPEPQRGELSGGMEAASIATSLGSGAVWTGIAAFFVYTGLEAVAGVWAYSYLTTVRGLSTSAAGLAVTLYWANLTIGRILFGVFVRQATLATMLRWTLLAIVLATTLLWLASSAALAVGAIALIGLACGPVYPSLMSQTPARVGEPHAANAVGFQVAAAAFGQSLLPTLVGWSARHAGLSVVAPALFVAAVVLLVLHEIFISRGDPDRAPHAAPVGRGAASP